MGIHPNEDLRAQQRKQHETTEAEVIQCRQTRPACVLIFYLQLEASQVETSGVNC